MTILTHAHTSLTAQDTDADTVLVDACVFAPTGDKSRHRIPSLLISNRGTLLAFSDHRRENWGDHHQQTDLVLRRSLDGGKSWEPMQVLAQDKNINHHSGPCLLDRDTGRIFKFFRRNPKDSRGNPDLHQRWKQDKKAYLEKGWGSFVMHSDDDGLSWSSPRRILFDLPEAGPGFQGTGNAVHGIQLRDGRLLVHAWAFRSPVRKHDGKVDGFSLFLISDDHGESWRPGPYWHCTHGVQEIVYVELNDEIYINCRSFGPHRLVARIPNSLNENPKPVPDTSLWESGCHAGLAMEGHGSQRLVFTNPPNKNTENKYNGDLRHHLTIRLSEDGGRSWPFKRCLDSGLTGYSDLQWHEGKIYCLYERGDQRYDDGINLRVITPEFIKSGS